MLRAALMHSGVRSCNEKREWLSVYVTELRTELSGILQLVLPLRGLNSCSCYVAHQKYESTMQARSERPHHEYIDNR